MNEYAGREKEIEAIEKFHSPRRRIWKGGRWRDDFCSRCRTVHPCPTYRLAAQLREAREKLAAVKNYSGDLRANRDVLDTVVVARELDRILKGGD